MAANLYLATFGVPPGVFGLYFFGPTQQQIPFGNGFRCVGPPLQRILPPTAAFQGVATRHVDLSQFPQIQPGVRLNFQHWYRDQGATGSTFNLSNGLNIQFF